MKKRTLLPLTLAAAFALTGCAGGGEAAPSSSPTAAETTAAAQTTSAAPTTEAAKPAGGQLSAQQLAEIADSLAGDNNKAKIIDEDMLAAQLKLADQAPDTLKIEPEKCAPFVESNSKPDLEKMNIVMVAIPGASAAQSTGIQVVSFPSVADADAELQKGKNSLSACSEYSISAEGITIEQKSSSIDAKSNASKTLGVRSVSVLPGGKITTISINAQEGQNLVVASVVGGSDEQKDIATAEELTNQALELIAGAK